jgi:CelD/BcsL family acetyltransferase involved in cellulose biosynthesis
MDTTYRIERIDTEAGLAGLRSAWTGLMAEVQDPCLFLTWDWVSVWWRHRDVAAGLWVLAAYDGGGQLAGLAPWMAVRTYAGPLPMRRLAFLGSGIVFPVELDVIARPGHKEAVCAAFVHYLETHRRDWDVLDLTDLDQRSPLAACVAQMGGRVRRLQPASARFTCLPGSFELYERDLMTGSRRGHMRQRRRKLEREHAGVIFEELTGPDAVQVGLDALKRLNQARFHGQQVASSFDHDRFVAFHNEMAPLALAQGWLRFYVLRVGEEIIAAVYGFHYGGVWYAYQAAFDDAWGRYSPGYLLFTQCIQHAIAEGAREWNMMRGDQEYKLSWTHEVRADDHLALSSSLPGHLWMTGFTLFENAKIEARRRLPQGIQDRIDRFVGGKVQTDEPADAKEISH